MLIVYLFFFFMTSFISGIYINICSLFFFGGVIGDYVAVAADVIPRSVYGIDDNMAGWDGKTYNYRRALEILKAQGYDTGGYTGVWGSDGRWALLHQKELVLNQEDTSNILSAVGIIRHIIDSIDLQSAY